MVGRAEAGACLLAACTETAPGGWIRVPVNMKSKLTVIQILITKGSLFASGSCVHVYFQQVNLNVSHQVKTGLK